MPYLILFFGAFLLGLIEVTFFTAAGSFFALIPWVIVWYIALSSLISFPARTLFLFPAALAVLFFSSPFLALLHMLGWVSTVLVFEWCLQKVVARRRSAVLIALVPAVCVWFLWIAWWYQASPLLLVVAGVLSLGYGSLAIWGGQSVQRSLWWPTRL